MMQTYVQCYDCGGRGTVLHCMDDICHGLGYCMHGDGETTCDTCGGTGTVGVSDNTGDDE